MERLTEKRRFKDFRPDEEITTICVDGYFEVVDNYNNFSCGKESHYYLVGEAIDKLAEYEDAEEQGLLLRLPCKVGDTVWFVCRIYDRTKKDFVRVVHNGYIKAIKFTLRPTKITVEYEDLSDTHGRCNGADFHVTSIGKTLFLTREEAEKALAEMG